MNFQLPNTFSQQTFNKIIDTLNAPLKDKMPIEIVSYTIVATLGVNCLLHQNPTQWPASAKKFVFGMIKKLPFVKREIEKELNKYSSSIEKDIWKNWGDGPLHTTLPEKGLPKEEILQQIESFAALARRKWTQGQFSGTVYGGNSELTHLNTEVYEKTLWSNPLHQGEFPDISKMESEVVAMVANLYGGDSNIRGVITSGGTDSIMEACRTYRNQGKEKGITQPVIIVPKSAHASFAKAAQDYEIQLIEVDIDNETGQVCLPAMEKALKKYKGNVIAIVGSLPSYPYGVIDPISRLSELAIKYNTNLHVDACLGGFIVPFSGLKEKFGFDLPGVTSISVDTHKYGLTPKGSSVILYRNEELIKHQYYRIPDWQGGIYATPSRLGSRAGASIATTYATLLYKGKEGYQKAATRIIDARACLEKEINKIEGIQVIGKPQLSVVAFTSNLFNIYILADKMSEKGYHLNKLQYPQAVHLCLTDNHTSQEFQERFIKDLKDCVAERLSKPNEKVTGEAEVYCTAQKISDNSIVNEVINAYLHATLRPYRQYSVN